MTANFMWKTGNILLDSRGRVGAMVCQRIKMDHTEINAGILDTLKQNWENFSVIQ